MCVDSFTTGVSMGGYTSWRLGVATGLPSAASASLIGEEKVASGEREEIKSLPWSSSINKERDLVYMPMLEDQLHVMKGLGMESVPVDDAFTFRASTVKPARIGNMCFKNDIFRNVRMTYFDADDKVQVYNSLWYPNYKYDLPLLGIDLISLGPKRVLTVVDFQPLHPSEEYSAKYIDHLGDTRGKYPNLQGTLSGKIYDDTSFFSNQMLFGRFQDESAVSTEVRPAFNDYLNAYISLALQATPNEDPAFMAQVKTRQAAYDEYSAAKDPAVGLFDAYFGKEWSADFVHEFLFTLTSQMEDGGEAQDSAAAPPTMAHNFKIHSSGSVTIGTKPENKKE